MIVNISLAGSVSSCLYRGQTEFNMRSLAVVISTKTPQEVALSKGLSVNVQQAVGLKANGCVRDQTEHNLLRHRVRQVELYLPIRSPTRHLL